MCDLAIRLVIKAIPCVPLQRILFKSDSVHPHTTTSNGGFDAPFIPIHYLRYMRACSSMAGEGGPVTASSVRLAGDPK